MKKALVALVILISGCVVYTPLLPENYTGDVAIINDTFERVSGGEANLYFVRTINGQSVYNALSATAKETSGRGLRLFTVGAAREVPVKPLKVHIVAQNYYAAPVQSMFGDNISIEGDVDFTPTEDKKYLVKGTLGEEYSAIWIEDIDGRIVSTTIESYDSSIQNGRTANKPVMKTHQSGEKLSREEYFARLSMGEREDFVVDKLGQPDRITENRRNIFVDRPDYTTYHYPGLGDVQFIGNDVKYMFVNKIIASVNGSPESIEKAKKLLETSEGVTLQEVVKSYYRMAAVDSSVLDLFAEKLWKEKDAGDKYMVDAISWICKLLGKSGNSRYRDLLISVAEEANTKKLRGYAQDCLELLPADIVAQFKPAG